MSELGVALGLVLVIEGLMWAIAPHAGRRLLEAAQQSDEQTLRLTGLAAVALGVFVVWLMRG